MGFPGGSAVKNLPTKEETWVRKIPGRRKWHLVYVSHLVMSDSLRPYGVARQAPLCMEFSRQEYSNGFALPSPGDLPDPGIESGSPTLQADSLPSEPRGNGNLLQYFCLRNPIDKGAWQATTHEVTKESDTT